jgi:hypothetical protein
MKLTVPHFVGAHRDMPSINNDLIASHLDISGFKLSGPATAVVHADVSVFAHPSLEPMKKPATGQDRR